VEAKTKVIIHMENEPSHSVNVEQLIQWLIFFGLVAVVFFPAFRFKRLATVHNRKGWLYFVYGLGVGIIGLNVGSLVARALRNYVVPPAYLQYSILTLFISAFVIYWVAYKLVENHLSKSERE